MDGWVGGMESKRGRETGWSGGFEGRRTGDCFERGRLLDVRFLFRVGVWLSVVVVVDRLLSAFSSHE